MQRHLHRRGGIWWVRLVVPTRLRQAVGRREYSQSCKTHDLTIAKMVAAVLLARWRRLLLALESHPMSIDVLKLVEGSPFLTRNGYFSLATAADLSGIGINALVQAAADGRLDLYCRVARLDGFVIHIGELILQTAFTTPAGKTLIRDSAPRIPSREAMPADSYEDTVSGVVPIFEPREFADEILAGDSTNVLVKLIARSGSEVFIPGEPVLVAIDRLEVRVEAVERLRLRLKQDMPIDGLTRAVELRRADRVTTASSLGKKAHKRISEAIAEFAREELRQTCGNPKERERIQTGIGLLIEFMGDLRLDEIDADVLRRFRDEHLCTVPSRLNHAASRFKTSGVKDTIAAIAESGADWPIMSAAERDQRMTWICRMFRWLKGDWLNEDPSAPLRGVSVLAKDEQKIESQKKNGKKRQPFTSDELTLIFSQSWFQTGNGQIAEATAMNQKWCSYQYWLPLMCLHAGQRIKELSQLHLSDVRQTKTGVWYLDINENTADKSLKNGESARVVPLHQVLIDAGFVEWCERLKKEGFQRLFPDLPWSSVTGYAKESIRSMSMMLAGLGMPRDNTKVFHSLRHTANNALIRHALDGSVPDMIRLRLLGHAGGKGENIESYFEDFVADESAKYVQILNFGLPKIARFDIEDGVKSIRSALARKHGLRKNKEDMGPLTLVATN